MTTFNAKKFAGAQRAVFGTRATAVEAGKPKMMKPTKKKPATKTKPLPKKGQWYNPKTMRDPSGTPGYMP